MFFNRCADCLQRGSNPLCSAQFLCRVGSDHTQHSATRSNSCAHTCGCVFEHDAIRWLQSQHLRAKKVWIGSGLSVSDRLCCYDAFRNGEAGNFQPAQQQTSGCGGDNRPSFRGKTFEELPYPWKDAQVGGVLQFQVFDQTQTLFLVDIWPQQANNLYRTVAVRDLVCVGVWDIVVRTPTTPAADYRADGADQNSVHVE